MPACQCGWVFYASVRNLRIADRTHGFHLDRGPLQPNVGFILSAAGTTALAAATAVPNGSPGPRDGGGRSDDLLV